MEQVEEHHLNSNLVYCLLCIVLMYAEKQPCMAFVSIQGHREMQGNLNSPALPSMFDGTFVLCS